MALHHERPVAHNVHFARLAIKAAILPTLPERRTTEIKGAYCQVGRILCIFCSWSSVQVGTVCVNTQSYRISSTIQLLPITADVRGEAQHTDHSTSVNHHNPHRRRSDRIHETNITERVTVFATSGFY